MGLWHWLPIVVVYQFSEYHQNQVYMAIYGKIYTDFYSWFWFYICESFCALEMVKKPTLHTIFTNVYWRETMEISKPKQDLVEYAETYLCKWQENDTDGAS